MKEDSWNHLIQLSEFMCVKRQNTVIKETNKGEDIETTTVRGREHVAIKTKLFR